MLAGDGNAGLAWPDPTVGIAMASPVFNFLGTSGAGIIGRRITFDLDVGATAGAGAGAYIQAGMSVGGASTFTLGGSLRRTSACGLSKIGSGPRLTFSSSFTMATALSAIRSRTPPAQESQTCSWTSMIFPTAIRGTAWAQRQLTSTSTPALWAVTRRAVADYVRLHYLERWANFAGFGLATHTFDNLTMYVGPRFPEPSLLSFWLG